MDGQGFLRETTSLIESGWCCGADARDCSGHAVAACDPTATAWSLCGALVVVSERPDAGAVALREALWGISGVIPDSSLDAWNDAHGRTQCDTVEMLGAATLNLTNSPPPVDWPAEPSTAA